MPELGPAPGPCRWINTPSQTKKQDYTDDQSKALSQENNNNNAVTYMCTSRRISDLWLLIFQNRPIKNIVKLET